MDLQSKVWLANEVRIWGLAVTALVGLISFAATWTHSRWQSELAAQKEEVASKLQRESDERIADAQARAAEANQKAEEERLARVRIEQRLADRNLSDEQFATVVEKLKAFVGQQYRVVTFWDLREPMAISNRISRAITAAGWEYLQLGPGGGILLGGLAGVHVYVHPQATPAVRNAARTAVEALSAEEISAELREINDPANPTNIIQFNVGTKP